MAVVGHDTEAMRQWSGNIERCAEDYDSLIKQLYSIVDALVATEFTGGLSKEFENAVIDKKANFFSLVDTLRDCADVVSNTSKSIDEDEAYLKGQIMNSSDILR